MSYTDKQLLDGLRRFYTLNQRLPKAKELTQANGYPAWSTYRQRFKSLKVAFMIAGLPIAKIRTRPKRYNRVDLLNRLLQYRLLHGNMPLYSDLNKRGEFVDYPHVRTYEAHFGSYNIAVAICEILYKNKQELTEENIEQCREVLAIHAGHSIKMIKVGSLEVKHLKEALSDVHCMVCENLIKRLDTLFTKEN